MNFSFDGKTNRNILIEDGFTFPVMAKFVEYNDSGHASYRRRLRSIREPFSFSVPLIVRNNQNKISRDEITNQIIKLLDSDGPKKLKLKDADWHFSGEFGGPFYIPPIINAFTIIDVEFTSSYSHKFYDDVKTFTTSGTHTVSSRTQLPTPPVIKLTGLTGNDVQITLTGKRLRRIRLTGNLPSNLTIDVENERIYETNSELNMIHLLRVDSHFEIFHVEHGDVFVINNGTAEVSFKELMK